MCGGYLILIGTIEEFLRRDRNLDEDNYFGIEWMNGRSDSFI